MLELPVRRFAEHDCLAAEPLEQTPAQHGPGAVIGVEHHAKPPLRGCGRRRRSPRPVASAPMSRSSTRSASRRCTERGATDAAAAVSSPARCAPVAAGITRPSPLNSLMPLYCGGLWLAEIWMPPAAPSAAPARPPWASPRRRRRALRGRRLSSAAATALGQHRARGAAVAADDDRARRQARRRRPARSAAATSGVSDSPTTPRSPDTLMMSLAAIDAIDGRGRRPSSVPL